MTNPQAALQAVATRYADSGLNTKMLLDQAQMFLAWLDERDVEREVPGDHAIPPLPVSDVQDDDEDTGPADRGLPR
jgi:hypothetical protein